MFKFIQLLPRIGQVIGQVQTKGWYASKTVIFNLLTLVFAVVSRFIDLPFEITQEEFDAGALFVSAIGNGILRFNTKGPIGVQRKPQPGSDEWSQLDGDG